MAEGWHNIFGTKYPDNCPITKCQIKQKDCSSEYKGVEVSISKEAPWKITALTNLFAGYDLTFCVVCENNEQALSAEVRVSQLPNAGKKKQAYITPSLVSQLPALVEVRRNLLVTLVLPGATKDMAIDGTFEVTSFKMYPGPESVFTTFIPSSDTHSSVGTYEFFYTDDLLVNQNYTTSFSLTSSNGLES